MRERAGSSPVTRIYGLSFWVNLFLFSGINKTGKVKEKLNNLYNSLFYCSCHII